MARLPALLDRRSRGGVCTIRIALVCPYAWDRFGGVQSHIRSLAKSLRERGNEVVVVAPRASLSPGSAVSGEEGVVIVGRAVPIPANGSVAPLAFGPLATAGVRRALRAFRPEVLHLHEPLIPSLSLLALWSSDVPAVGTFHAAAGSSAAYGMARPVLRHAFDRLALRTVVSEAARALVSRYFDGDFVVTPNGVDVTRYRSAPPVDLGASKSVLFFGRIERRKGLELLVQAMARLRDLDATLVVAGAGPQEAACRALARRLEVKVRWLGAPHDDLKPGMFAGADVYCAPNTGGESFGIVLIEAMAAGAPVVCSDLPGFRAVAGDAAVLFSFGDAGSLADGLRSVLCDEALARRLSAAGQEVAKTFDWPRLAGDVEAIYRRAVKG